MGCDTKVSCPACRVTHDCGYGSYRSFNRRAERALEKHESCKGVVAWSSDYTSHRGDDLMIDARYGRELFIEGEKSFAQLKEDE